jgi:hypothetical protein
MLFGDLGMRAAEPEPVPVFVAAQGHSGGHH